MAVNVYIILLSPPIFTLLLNFCVFIASYSYLWLSVSLVDKSWECVFCGRGSFEVQGATRYALGLPQIA